VLPADPLLPAGGEVPPCVLSPDPVSWDVTALPPATSFSSWACVGVGEGLTDAEGLAVGFASCVDVGAGAALSLGCACAARVAAACFCGLSASFWILLLHPATKSTAHTAIMITFFMAGTSYLIALIVRRENPAVECESGKLEKITLPPQVPPPIRSSAR
jgi:hypothetical protein